ncbi:vacuolar sorting protein 9 (VPS9) domain-containing protein [Ditylenchus destructor]|uniref:Receptor-mediated endocytosis protein 6 n=1 Tax=Ditylenchus destructor TaxID=166010 RepID=A0AAD4N986_9BILA|nr:vacuolar sorting protein 9 (VPS9) domain-containing protein [Ditylenchus destructor]
MSHQKLIHNSSSMSKIHQKLVHSASISSSHPKTYEHDASDNLGPVGYTNVEVLNIPFLEVDFPIGLASEETVMNSLSRSPYASQQRNSSKAEKRARFTAESVVSDRTGVTDDDSSCSSSNDNVANDDDDEAEEDILTLPDNFSDVLPISANDSVSARGSPSLSISGERMSGRAESTDSRVCTPFSGNAPEQNDSTAPGAADTNTNESRRHLPPPLLIPVTVRKQNPEGLEEKFGKFALPPQEPSRYKDETYSAVSDSWSTDVVASDNEGYNDIARSDAQNIANASLAQSIPSGSGHRNSLLSANINANTSGSLSSAMSGLQMRAPSSIVDSMDRPYYDPENLTECSAFIDAKRKLRLVLSSASNLQVPYVATGVYSAQNICPNNVNGANVISEDRNHNYCNVNESERLNQLLTILLAESINNRDKMFASQIREVQRCLATFDEKGIRKLLKTLRHEHRKRTSYLLYLQNSRLTLLQLNYHLARTKLRIQREKSLTAECLIEMLVRFYLKDQDRFLHRFIHDFKMLKAQDEKTDAVDRALQFLHEQLLVEPMWRYATAENLEYAYRSLERALMAHIYGLVLFPNGEADHCRDEVFCKSMQKLANVITVNHPELGIPKKFHGECPWPSAQAEIAIINAYKSPRDKMGCVVRCCETIENLIVLSSERGTASADDLLPVLVFVLIQANPPSLLSSIQYIDDFYASHMQGKMAYWWTQFTAAVEFLKQLLNRVLM